MLAGNGEAGAREAEGVLLLRAAGQDFAFAASEPNRLRRVAACAAHRQNLPGDDADNGIINAGVDAAVVMSEDVSDIGEALLGFVVVDDDGLFTDVAAGHDERGFDVPASAQDA